MTHETSKFTNAERIIFLDKNRKKPLHRNKKKLRKTRTQQKKDRGTKILDQGDHWPKKSSQALLRVYRVLNYAKQGRGDVRTQLHSHFEQARSIASR